jgi:hypothetical protein
MRQFFCKVPGVAILAVLAIPGCSDGERAIAGQRKLASIDQRPSLANPLRAATSAPRQAVRRNVIQLRTAR